MNDPVEYDAIIVAANVQADLPKNDRQVRAPLCSTDLDPREPPDPIRRGPKHVQ